MREIEEKQEIEIAKGEKRGGRAPSCSRSPGAPRLRLVVDARPPGADRPLAGTDPLEEKGRGVGGVWFCWWR